MTETNIIQSRVALFRNLVGEGQRICYLVNAFAYRLEYAFIIADRQGFRLVVKSIASFLADRRFKTLGRARESILALLKIDRIKLMYEEAPRWSEMFLPDEQFFHNLVKELMSFWRYKIGRPWPMASASVSGFISKVRGRFGTILVDPPWRFRNRTGKIAPEHKRLNRYQTLSFDEIRNLPLFSVAAEQSHLYLWLPNALLKEGVSLMEHWGFDYKTNLVWCKTRRDGQPAGSGVGFYFRNATELVLFGVKNELRTLPPARNRINIMFAPRGRHSRKPEELYRIIESCSPGPYLELFARQQREGWTQWGDQIDSGA